MEQLTEKVIVTLKSLPSREAAAEYVSKEVKLLRTYFESKGYRFLKNDSNADQQMYWGDDVGLFHHYEELVAIKWGLTTGWVSDTDEPERFGEIQEATEEALEGR